MCDEQSTDPSPVSHWGTFRIWYTCFSTFSGPQASKQQWVLEGSANVTLYTQKEWCGNKLRWIQPHLCSTQPLTEMSTRNLTDGKERPARKADKLTAICEPIVKKMWEPRRLTALWASTACYRDSFTLFFLRLNNKTLCLYLILKSKRAHNFLQFTFAIKNYALGRMK
jgi:hypothetical protein